MNISYPILINSCTSDDNGTCLSNNRAVREAQ